MASQSRNGEFSGPPLDKFGKPGVSYPTPNPDDLVIVEQIPIEKAQYKRLAYGIAHKDFPSAKLISQKRTAGEDNKYLVTRVYATNRENQDAYNFSLSWALNSKAHLVVTRSSLILRSEYVTTAQVNGVTQVTVNAAPNFTPDPTFAGALLVSESSAPAEPPYDTLYLRVTRTFETIAGPILTGEEFTKIGRTLTLIPPEFLGNQRLYTSTQVVRPGTQADAQDSVDANGHIVVSSVVTPIDATHSSKSNVARENAPYPTLHGAELENSVGGAVVQAARSIVATGTQPPEGFLVIGASEKALSATEILQEVKTVTAYPELVGAGFESNIPERFLGGFNLEEDIDWVDTTSTPATTHLSTGPLVVSCQIAAETKYRGKRVTKRLPAGSTLPTLTSQRVNGEGLLETVTEKITFGSYVLPPTTALTTVNKADELSDGVYLMTFATVPSYPAQQAQGFDKRLGLTKPRTIQVLPTADAVALIGQPNKDIEPIDYLRTRVVTDTLTTAAQAALDAYLKPVHVTIPRLDFPDILDAVIVEWETAQGKGDASETGVASGAGYGTVSLNSTKSGQGSATVIPDVQPIIRSLDASNVPATDWVFFVPDGTSLDDVLAKVSAQPWPVWQKVSETFTCKGQKLSVRASSSARLSIAYNKEGNSLAVADGTSGDQDFSSTVRSITTKPCIHGPIGLGVCTKQATATGASSAYINLYVQASRTIELKARGSVSPCALTATPGFSEIPTSEVFAYRVNGEMYEHGYTMYRVTTIDFAYFGSTPATPGSPQEPLPDSVDAGTSSGSFTAPDNIGGGDGGTGGGGTTVVAPTISVQPSGSVRVSVGQSASLSVEAAGTSPTFQWSKDGTDIPGATEATYTIASVASGDAGDYIVTVTNSAGSVTSATSHIYVGSYGAVVINTQPSNVTVTAGQSATFTVTATGSGTLTYQWYRNPTLQTLIPGATGATFTIPSVTSGDADGYYVKVSNGTDDDNSTQGILTVNTAAVISSVSFSSPSSNQVIKVNAQLGRTAVQLAFSTDVPVSADTLFNLSTNGAGAFLYGPLSTGDLVAHNGAPIPGRLVVITQVIVPAGESIAYPYYGGVIRRDADWGYSDAETDEVTGQLRIGPAPAGYPPSSRTPGKGNQIQFVATGGGVVGSINVWLVRPIAGS